MLYLCNALLLLEYHLKRFSLIWGNLFLVQIGNKVVHKIVFMIDLDCMHNIKQLADDSLSMGCMTCLFSCLYI
jgi:hypothetical protein